jgi:hypothetical protein
VEVLAASLFWASVFVARFFIIVGEALFQVPLDWVVAGVCVGDLGSVGLEPILFMGGIILWLGIDE